MSGEVVPATDDKFADVQAAIDAFADDELKQRVMLVRLAMRINNGDEHFDHGTPGYSWLCHLCALEGKGGLNGWAGAAYVMAEASVSSEPRRWTRAEVGDAYDDLLETIDPGDDDQ